MSYILHNDYEFIDGDDMISFMNADRKNALESIKTEEEFEKNEKQDKCLINFIENIIEIFKDKDIEIDVKIHVDKHVFNFNKKIEILINND